MVDGQKLWKTNGNNKNEWEDVGLVDKYGENYKLLDVMEHLDRLLVLSENTLFVSANLEPDKFDDPVDSIEIVVGTGKGRNIGIGRIEDTVYIFNTEGIFYLAGDVLSAVAETFEIRLVDEKVAIATRTIVPVEKAILFLADDLELYSWDGNTAKLISYEEQLKLDINPDRIELDKAVATYDNVAKYYKLSVVKKGDTYNTLEYWYDALEDKIDMVEGRNISCYVHTDPTVENRVTWVGKSDKMELQREGGRNFDEKAPAILLRTTELPIGKIGENARISNIYPKYECTGERNMFFRYLLDSRLSDGERTTEIINLGYDEDGASTDSITWTNGTIGTFFTMVDTAYINTLFARCYIQFSGLANAIIYSYNAGLPGTVLAKSNVKTVSGTMSWEQFIFPSSLKLEKGTKYGLAIQLDTGPNMFCSYDLATAESWTTNNTGTNIAETDRQFSIYVPYTRESVTEVANFTQDLSGEAKALGFVRIANQKQTTDRIKPRIKYARGETITFEVVDHTKDMELKLLGIGYDIIQKGRIKGKGVSQ